MDKIHVSSSLYIKNSIVETDVNTFMGKIIGLFFKSISFETESLRTLKEYQQRVAWRMCHIRARIRRS